MNTDPAVHASAAVLRPVERLKGIALDGGWTVLDAVPLDPNVQTGGAFSAGYIVEKEGIKAFLKALDFSKAMSASSHIDELNKLTSEYIFERDILEICANARMSRVIRILGHGSIDVDPTLPFGIGKVSYLIFELAEADIRKHLSFVGSVEFAWIFKLMHQTCVAIQQLHGRDIAHQDLKPSNVLLFDKENTKIADLGRAVSKMRSSPHDALAIPGDTGYTAPEFLYGYHASDWTDHRESSDLYLLGSLLVFMFTGVSMTQVLFSKIDKARWPKFLDGGWAGSYAEVLPFLINGFSLTMEEIIGQLPDEYRPDLRACIGQMCHPDPHTRGHPDSRANVGKQVGIDRFVSLFDRLSRRTLINLRR